MIMPYRENYKDYSGNLDPAIFFGYGYAPGNYMSICYTCQSQFGPTDKRSITCLSCAEKLITQSNQGATNGLE